MTDVPAALLATNDARVLDDGLRWCAALGVVVEQAADVTAVRRSWRHAALVVVGHDLAADLARAGLARREHVLIVAPDPEGWWSVAVTLGAAAVCRPDDEDRVIEVLAGALDGRAEACVVAVVGGVGGAGASTFTVALGLAARRRRLRPLVVDADPLGGGLELVLGAERVDGLRWDDFAATRGRVDAASLTDVVPVHRGVSSLSWTAGTSRSLPRAVPSVLDAAVRGFDLVAVDVPRHLDAAGAEIVGRSVLSVLLVPEEIAAVAAARHVLAGLHGCAPAIGLVSVARRGGIGPGALVEALKMPVLARVRPDRRVRGAVDRGLGPGSSRRLRRAADAVLDALGLDRA
ncbi:MAG: septum site-determining protein Ssd [Aeromicrobium sp.]